MNPLDYMLRARSVAIVGALGSAGLGGCDLMMMCDLAVAADDAVFGQPEIRFGSALVAQVMPWLIGALRAKELVFSGFDRPEAPCALEIVLVNRVRPLDRLAGETMSLAPSVAVVDPEVMRVTKLAINASWENAGFRRALRTGAEFGSLIESSLSPEREQFEQIVRDEELGAAPRWRDGRFSQ